MLKKLKTKTSVNFSWSNIMSSKKRKLSDSENEVPQSEKKVLKKPRKETGVMKGKSLLLNWVSSSSNKANITL